MKSLVFIRKYIIILSVICVTGSPVVAHHAYASDITVTDNGSATSNEATSTNATETSVSSTNETAIENVIASETDTGNNSASNNNGEATITTGSVSTDTTVENTGNATTVNSPCCSKSGTIVLVSGNGTGSQNIGSVNQTKSTTYTGQQSATIVNTVYGAVSTGNNRASDNSGNVTIVTGKITVKVGIKNSPINHQTIVLEDADHGQEALTMQDNGANSVNTLHYEATMNRIIAMNNYANIFNNVVLNLSTGDNQADRNDGNVAIQTGDISLTTEIENEVNHNTVASDCHCKEHHEPTPTPTQVDKVTPSPNNDKPGSGSGVGEVASIAASKELPVTGLNWIIIAFVGNVMMLFLGMILRLRSGNAPGLAV